MLCRLTLMMTGLIQIEDRPSGHNAPQILPLDADEPFNPSLIPENEEGKKRQLAKQFQGAKKAQCQSWIENDVCDLVGMRDQVRNFVAGRWVLTEKKDKECNFQKCKARWVLEEYPATRKPCRISCRFPMLAPNYHWDLYHMDRRVKPMMKRETSLERHHLTHAARLRLPTVYRY